jgi:predicted heme/steroid binding protein
MAEQEFTLETLAQFDGKGGRAAYVAFQGKVYDVSESYSWEDGEHYSEHAAGTDLTDELDFAPHGTDVMDAFPVVGVMKQ